MVKRDTKKNLREKLIECLTEEEVKQAYANTFGFKLNTKYHIDHYSEAILYEFKYDDNLKNIHTLSKVIAQTLYYIHKIKYGTINWKLPPRICIADKNEALIFPTDEYRKLYSIDTYDWDLQPSNPDEKLVEAIQKFPYTSKIHVYNLSVSDEEEQFIELHKHSSEIQTTLLDHWDKKVITEDNFLGVYEYWNSLFGEYVQNGRKASEYFVLDIEEGKSNPAKDSQILFETAVGNWTAKTIPKDDYEHFWSIYEKADLKTVFAIRQKIDRLSEDYSRRFSGEFYTPVEFASKGWDYLKRVVGKELLDSGKWRLWDMCAGTGNLEFVLPTEMLDKCYISSLLEDDVKYCKRIFSSSTVFQYDFLNDDAFMLNDIDDKLEGIPYKLPKNLIEDLNNPELTWIILINPPFAMSSTAGKSAGKKSKNSVSDTEVRKFMDALGLKESSRELTSQFIYRISKLFGGKSTYLGMFSKIKYINSNNDQKLRDTVFHYKFEKGFIFSSKAFHGSKGNFPVGFLIWNLNQNKPIEEQILNVDVYNEFVEKYATKKLQTVVKSELLPKWINPRPRCKEIMPPLSSGLTVAYENKDKRDRVADGFLCSQYAVNDLQHQNWCMLLSSPYVSAGAYSITKDNFEKSMVIHAVTHIPKHTWINDADRYFIPSIEIGEEFIHDCVIWSAFADSNNCTSMKDVKYEGKTYQIKNEMFPISLKELSDWKFGISDLHLQMFAEKNDRYLARWIESHKLSKEAQAVLKQAKLIFKLFFENITKTRWMAYKIENWDVGWYQIRMALSKKDLFLDEMNRFKELHKNLENKLLPKIYEYGFIPDGVVEF